MHRKKRCALIIGVILCLVGLWQVVVMILQDTPPDSINDLSRFLIPPRPLPRVPGAAAPPVPPADPNAVKYFDIDREMGIELPPPPPPPLAAEAPPPAEAQLPPQGDAPAKPPADVEEHARMRNAFLNPFGRRADPVAAENADQPANRKSPSDSVANQDAALVLNPFKIESDVPLPPEIKQIGYGWRSDVTDAHGTCNNGWDGILVNTEFKLLYCTQPKVGTTAWKRVFMRLNGQDRWMPDDDNLHWRQTNHLKYLYYDFSAGQATEILNDPSYFKATYFRHPYKRLLSAYLDKIAMQGGVGAPYALNRYGIPTDAPFDWFIKWLSACHAGDSPPSFGTKKNCEGYLDVHWMPQICWCGHPSLLSKYDYVGDLDNLETDGPKILRRVGALEKMTPWGANGQGQVFKRSAQDHPTESNALLDTLFTDELKALADRIFAKDLEIWRQTQPE